MSEQPQNPTGNPPDNPQNQPQNQPPAQPQNQPPTQQSNTSAAPGNNSAQQTAHAVTADLLSARTLQDMRTELAALPERIVNAIREGTQPPRPTPTGGESTNPSAHTPGSGDPNRPPSKRFADWWFGT